VQVRLNTPSPTSSVFPSSSPRNPLTLIFPSSLVILSIPEDTKNGTLIYIAQAMSSFATNFSVVYTLAESSSGLVTVDGKLGEMRIRERLDFEHKPTEVEFVVVASNGGVERLASMRVRVNITDVNDNEPVFTEKSYTFTVNQTRSSAVSVVEEEDALVRMLPLIFNF